ncbi:DUF1269 domain-containing protein [Streptomyces sp. NPDC046716]|uniref:DUF1269 domain-containing protein n=1 Tax=Streptomyces sp. NPDC046716 TaxID=3157093 RepID=UPI0033CC64C1
MPLLGAAVGAFGGALGGSLVDVGIDVVFIAWVRGEVEPGASALFLLTFDAVLGPVHQAFPDGAAELSRGNLSHRVRPSSERCSRRRTGL